MDKRNRNYKTSLSSAHSRVDKNKFSVNIKALVAEKIREIRVPRN